MSDDLIIRAAIRDELSAPLEGIRQELRATGQSAETAGRKANIGARGFDAMAGGVGRMLKATGRAAVIGLTALTAAIGAVTIGAATMGIKTAAQMQNASVAFTTMLGSGKKAAAFLSDLQKFAAATPFEFPELQTAASSLISAGIKAKDVIPIMTTLGNVTSGMGTGSEGIQRATIALQQMTAAGKITAEDLAQLRDAGIPVYDLLAKATGRAKSEVVALAQSGKLGAKDLAQMMDALKTGKGMERFAGLMDKQSATLGGVWSTLKDTINMGLANAIKPAIPLLTELTLAASGVASDHIFPAISRGLSVAVKWIDVARQSFRGAVTDTTGISDGMALFAIRVGYLARTAGPFLRTIFDVIKGGAKDTSGMSDKVALLAISIGAKLRPVVEFVRGAFGKLMDLFKGAKSGDFSASFSSMGHSLQVLGPPLQELGGKIKDATDKLPSLGQTASTAAAGLKFVADHADTLIKYLPLLAAAFVAVKVAQAANNTVGKNSVLGFYLSTAASVADTVSKLALAGANRALATSIQGSVLATNTQTTTTIRGRIATVASTVASKAAAGAAKVWAAGQWLLNAALSANPIGLVVLSVAALAIGLAIAWKKSATFRDVVKAAFSGVLTAVDKVLESTQLLMQALSHVPGFGWAKDAADAIGRARDKVKSLKDEMDGLKDKTVTISVKTVGAQAIKNAARLAENGISGDTATSHARGAGGLGSTLAMHSALSSGQTITNALVGGGGRGHGSGDHQAGRALDLTGPGLPGYASKLRAAGGFAQMHGAGQARHLHAVYPAGDTARSMTPRVASTHGSGPGSMTIGSVHVEVTNPASGIDVRREVVAALRQVQRDQAERA